MVSVTARKTAHPDEHVTLCKVRRAAHLPYKQFVFTVYDVITVNLTFMCLLSEVHFHSYDHLIA